MEPSIPSISIETMRKTIYFSGKNMVPRWFSSWFLYSLLRRYWWENIIGFTPWCRHEPWLWSPWMILMEAWFAGKQTSTNCIHDGFSSRPSLITRGGEVEAFPPMAQSSSSYRMRNMLSLNFVWHCLFILMSNNQAALHGRYHFCSTRHGRQTQVQVYVRAVELVG